MLRLNSSDLQVTASSSISRRWCYEKMCMQVVYQNSALLLAHSQRLIHFDCSLHPVLLHPILIQLLISRSQNKACRSVDPRISSGNRNLRMIIEPVQPISATPSMRVGLRGSISALDTGLCSCRAPRDPVLNCSSFSLRHSVCSWSIISSVSSPLSASSQEWYLHPLYFIFR